MHINDLLFLLSIPKQNQQNFPFSCSGLSLPGRGHILVRCSHTKTGLRTPFMFLQFLVGGGYFINGATPFSFNISHYGTVNKPFFLSFSEKTRGIFAEILRGSRSGASSENLELIRFTDLGLWANPVVCHAQVQKVPY